MEHGARTSVADFILFLADGVDSSGKPPSEIASAAAAAAAAGIKTLAIGIGKEIDQDQLLVIAGSPERVRTVDSFDQLLGGSLNEWICAQLFQ